MSVRSQSSIIPKEVEVGEHSDLRSQISDLRFQISDLRFQIISDLSFQISDFRFQISDFRYLRFRISQIVDFRYLRFQISDYFRSLIHFGSQISDFKIEKLDCLLKIRILNIAVLKSEI